MRVEVIIASDFESFNCRIFFFGHPVFNSLIVEWKQTSSGRNVESADPQCIMYFIVHVFLQWRSELTQRRVERLWVNLASVSQAPPPHLSNLSMKESLLASSYCRLSPALE